MKKLIDRFKKWLIVKLGGYTTPYSVTKHYKLSPTKVSATVKVDRCEAINEEFLLDYLVNKLAQEIGKSNLIDVRQCLDYQNEKIVYEMSVLVVDPKECY